MNLLPFQKLQTDRYEGLRSTLHAYLEKSPNADLSKGILELKLHKLNSLTDKVRFLEKEIRLAGLKISDLAQKQSDKINNLLNLH